MAKSTVATILKKMEVFNEADVAIVPEARVVGLSASAPVVGRDLNITCVVNNWDGLLIPSLSSKSNRLTRQFDIHISRATHPVKSAATRDSLPAHQAEV
ncbi:hypothetical protein E2C01_013156 [Portunus trituberculatus]|uniref:Uncharacterized protein n=1 Tax=Portunus trituberculatus TaxID=210409 RepID=A0A5B7DFV9_PORTR|nr:hypothetical protein [Portunus trituberculatus]